MRPRTIARKIRTPWWVPAGLILLSVIPLTFGAIHLYQLINGAEITTPNPRIFASPAPVVIHIISAAIYALLGAFQFVSRLWQRGIKWHRWVGRLLLPFGLLVGFSGLWMTLFYPYPAGASDLLYVLRLFFGSGMILSIILGYHLDPTAGCCSAPSLDDACLCHWDGCRHTSADRDGRSSDLWQSE